MTHAIEVRAAGGVGLLAVLEKLGRKIGARAVLVEVDEEDADSDGAQYLADQVARLLISRGVELRTVAARPKIEGEPRGRWKIAREPAPLELLGLVAQ